MKRLIIAVYYLSVASVVSSQVEHELTVRQSTSGDAASRLLVAFEAPFSPRVALTGATVFDLSAPGDTSSGARSEESAPEFGVSFASEVIDAGSLHLHGLLAEMRSPVAAGASTSHWEDPPGVTADLSLNPLSRTGVAIHLPFRMELAGWRERERLMAAFSGAATLGSVQFAGAVVASTPAEEAEATSGWSELDLPPEERLIAGAHALFDGDRWAAAVATAVSVGSWTPKALWVRVAWCGKNRGGGAARLYTVGTSPAFYSLTDRVATPAMRAAAAVEQTVGSLRMGVGLSAGYEWYAPGVAQWHAVWRETELDGSLDLALLDDGITRVSLSVDLDLSWADELDTPDRDGTYGLSFRTGAVRAAISQRIEFADEPVHSERARVALSSGSLRIGAGDLRLDAALSAETEWNPFELIPELILTGRYRGAFRINEAVTTEE